MTKDDTMILDKFSRHGRFASFHYADDTCEEWSLGDRQKAQALKLFDENPRLQPQMRMIAKDFLWSLNMERKETKDDKTPRP